MSHHFLFRRTLLLCVLLALVYVSGLPSNSTAATQFKGEEKGFFGGGTLQSSPHLSRSRRAFSEEQSTTPVGPGVDLTTLVYRDEAGLVRASILNVDLNDERVTPRLLYPGVVAGRATVSQMAADSGAIAAINGDFFDIRYTNAPYGVAISDGNLLKGPIHNWTHAAGIGEDRVGRIADVHVWGDAFAPAGKIVLSALNQHNIQPDGVGLYTPLWGDAGRGRAVERVGRVREVTVSGGVVTGVSDGAGAGVPGDGFVLLGREGGADALASLNIGDAVDVQYGPLTDVPVPFQMAIGGGTVLVRDGQVQSVSAKGREPRSAVGFSEDGKRMFLVAVDGRQRGSRGQTLRELAELMRRVGAWSALNLDGGGSSTLLARRPGEWRAELTNTPSTGEERYVPNGIGIYAAPGSGTLAGIRIFPAAGEANDRVFPGLSRQMAARPYDETYAPVGADDLTWQCLTPNGTFEGDVFRAGTPGDAFVQAQANGANGAVASDARVLHVLPPLARIVPTLAALSLNASSGPQFFRVSGESANGQSAPIELRDVSLSYDETVISVAASDDGQLQITPNIESGATTLTISAVGVSANVPVFVGLQSAVVDEFEDATRWIATASGGANAVIGNVSGKSGKALQLAYVFTSSDSPHRASAQANELHELPGRPLQIGVWVRGSGRGEQISFTVRGVDGAVRDMAGPSVSGDWQYVEVDVPQDVAFPLQLLSLNVDEPDPSDQYSGQVVFDGLGVKTVR